MDNEQITSRIEWLDDERRKDKTHIAELIKKVSRLESAIEKSDKSVKAVSRDIGNFEIKLEKAKEFPSFLNAHKEELKKEVDTISKTLVRREREEKKLFDTDISRANISIDKLKVKLEEIKDLKSEIMILKEGEGQVKKMVNDLDQKIREFADHDVERGQTIKLMEEDRRKDNLRVIDLTGEISAVRKKIDEYSTHIEINLENQKRSENKIDEVVKVERERVHEQREFTENIDRQMVNRSREWKQWENKFDDFETQISSIDVFVEKITLAERDVRKAQQSFEEITEKIDRRINEITEMQRLGEERFRNEWATFRASDHKRWTNYAMAQEEKQRESARLIEKSGKSISGLIDDLDDIKEIQKFLLEQTDKNLKALLDSIGEMSSESERFLKGLE
jgi:chromosome segregation ATPase